MWIDISKVFLPVYLLMMTSHVVRPQGIAKKTLNKQTIPRQVRNDDLPEDFCTGMKPMVDTCICAITETLNGCQDHKISLFKECMKENDDVTNNYAFYWWWKTIEYWHEGLNENITANKHWACRLVSPCTVDLKTAIKDCTRIANNNKKHTCEHLFKWDNFRNNVCMQVSVEPSPVMSDENVV